MLSLVVSLDSRCQDELNIRVKLVPAALPAYMACFGVSEKKTKFHDVMERDRDTCRIMSHTGGFARAVCENRALS